MAIQSVDDFKNQIYAKIAGESKMEQRGLEPLTYGLQSHRSPN